MLVNLSSYGLGYPRPYGDMVTNIRGRGCLYEGDSLKNHYPRGGGELIRGGGRSIKYLLSRGVVRSFEGGGGGRGSSFERGRSFEEIRYLVRKDSFKFYTELKLIIVKRDGGIIMKYIKTCFFFQILYFPENLIMWL